MSLCRRSYQITPRCAFAWSFFFNDTATTEIYTLSLHDALPISPERHDQRQALRQRQQPAHAELGDRKSTRLNSSHPSTSYAVFCLKKKNHTTGFKAIFSGRDFAGGQATGGVAE